MKRVVLVVIIVFISLLINVKPVNAQEIDKNESFDESINEILLGINEDDFAELTVFLNDLFNGNKTLKEWVVAFLTGEETVDLDNIKKFLSGAISNVLTSVLEIVCYVLFIGITYTISNIIICKKSDNYEYNIIYFICYSVVVTLFVFVVSKVFESATESVNKMTKTIEVVFPLLITLGEFCGGFGVGLFKPITAVSSFLSSVLFSNFYIPIISTCFLCVIVGNISSTFKLNSLSKTLLSLIKWTIGIITIVFSIVLASQSLVNSQYNGLSFKIFKYATGSMIPIVGNFISGGLDTLISSAIIVKNSFGLILVLYLIFIAIRSGITILLTSFILRFFISLSEPILDNKFITLTNGVCEVLNVLSATVFISAFSYILVSLTVMNSTSLII